jgi:alanyl-tRNA synthetase
MEVVTCNIPVETVFNDEEAQARSRFGPIEADVIRVVKIGTHDTSACCGAHVATTGCIGVIRIFDLETKKQGTRVSFRAGPRALEQSQFETATLRDLRKLAGCATAELPALFQKAQERSKELAKEVDRLWLLRLSDLAKSAKTVTVGSAKTGIYLGELPGGLASTLAGMIAEATNGTGIVVSDTRIAISSTALDAGALLKAVRDRIGGKGGGSAKAANGRLDRPVTMAELIDVLNAKD